MEEESKGPMSLGEVMKNMLRKSENSNEKLRPVLDEAMCPRCHRVSPAWDGLAAALIERGLTFAEAQPGICQCALEAEERKARWLEVANLPTRVTTGEPRTLENFHMVEGSEDALLAMRVWLRGEGPPVVTLVGGMGCGKSHLLEAVGRALVGGGTRCRYEESATMMERMRPHEQDEDRDWLAYYQMVPVLLLDDLGVEKASDWTIERLTAVLSPRLRERRRTLISTNLSRGQMLKGLGAIDGIGAQRLVSRLFGEETGEAKVVHMTCPDYRTGERW